MDNPYVWLQDWVELVPDFLQPIIVALVAAIPYVEGEGAAALGIIVGIHPLIAAIAAATGNILCVIGVVYLGSRIRGGVVARRRARVSVGQAAGHPRESGDSPEPAAQNVNSAADSASGASTSNRRSKGRAKLRRWMVKFGVPGASILAPLALPTMLTAAFFVASGVRREWVILWQIVAIILWTGVVAAAATGFLTVIGW